MLLVEIGLTIWAWRRGWKGWSLVPWVAVLLIAFLVGAAVGVSGGEVENVEGLGSFIELVGIVALIVMIARPRTATTRRKARSAVTPPESVLQ